MQKDYLQKFFNIIREKFKKYLISRKEIDENWSGFEKEGAFGIVTKGRFRQKDVAIKKIQLMKKDVKDMMKNESELTSLIAELSAMKKVDLDNIPKLQGININDEKLEIFFLTDLIEGKTLRELLDKTQLSWNYIQKLWLAIKIAKILAYITSEGVIHRDVKPENIMITEDSNLEPYLIDFGLAKIKESDKMFTLTHAKCTPSYSPPENIFCDEEKYAEKIGSSLESLNTPIGDSATLRLINYKVDVWSFGCVLYELFAGKMPWSHLVKTEINIQHIIQWIKQDKNIYSDEDVKAEQDIMNIVVKCTRQSVKERCDIKEVVDDLERILKSKRIVTSEVLDELEYNGEVMVVSKDDNEEKDVYIYDGFGNLVVLDDEGEKISYTGNFQYGKKFELGIENGQNHNYIGYWKNNMKHGYGFYKCTEYSVDSFYRGKMKSNKKEGYGIYLLGNETLMKGEFVDDYLKEGVKVSMEDGKLYKGSFKNEIFVLGEVWNIKDTGELFEEGNTSRKLSLDPIYYRGEYKDNERNGFGFLIDFTTGEIIHKGLWKDGKIEKQIN